MADEVLMYLSAPVRHAFMLGAVWHQRKGRPTSDFNILEVGSWCGASTLTWAEGLEIYNDAHGTLTCVDAWEPYPNGTEAMNARIAEAYDTFKRNMKSLPASISAEHIRGAGYLPKPLPA